MGHFEIFGTTPKLEDSSFTHCRQGSDFDLFINTTGHSPPVTMMFEWMNLQLTPEIWYAHCLWCIIQWGMHRAEGVQTSMWGGEKQIQLINKHKIQTQVLKLQLQINNQTTDDKVTWQWTKEKLPAVKSQNAAAQWAEETSTHNAAHADRDWALSSFLSYVSDFCINCISFCLGALSYQSGTKPQKRLGPPLLDRIMWFDL